MGLNERIHDLSEALKATAEYSRLRQAKMVLEKNPALKKELEDFNKKQSELLSGKLSSVQAESRVKELNSRFEAMSKISEVDAYLKALKSFDSVLSKVYKSLGDSLDNGFR